MEILVNTLKVESTDKQLGGLGINATDLGLKIVPLIGMMTIQEAIDYVKQGFKSTIAENKDCDAEGLVLKTLNGLLRRNGERLITKIKTVDFRKYESVYGSK